LPLPKLPENNSTTKDKQWSVSHTHWTATTIIYRQIWRLK